VNGHRWLGKAPVLWVLDDAPGVPPHLVSTLIAVARYASSDGIGAYPSAATVAMHTRKSERQAKRDLGELARIGLLLPGDPRIVAALRADQRPNVYNLAMPRGDAHDTPLDANGVTPMTERGDTGVLDGVSPMSPEEILNKSGRGVRGANGAAAPRHAKPKTPRRARQPACDRDGPGKHSEACRAADSARCGVDWCECRCHIKALTA
jgi:hypothetical protein